jgi:hypothetical protein
MEWARHGKCESDTSALCKSNGKDTFQTLSGTAWQGNGMSTACYVWIGLNGAVYYRPRCRRPGGTVRSCPTTLLAAPRPALSKEFWRMAYVTGLFSFVWTRELFCLTHNFIIVKIHTYHQGNTFQLQGAIIKPLYKNRSLSGFWCMIGIPVVYITGVLLYTVF